MQNFDYFFSVYFQRFKLTTSCHKQCGVVRVEEIETGDFAAACVTIGPCLEFDALLPLPNTVTKIK